MDFSPAVSTRIAEPSEAQAWTTTTEGSAVSGSWRNATEPSPRALRTPLARPPGSYMYFQTLPTATTVVTIGRKYRVRHSPWNRSRSTQVATTTEPVRASATVPSANSSVLVRTGTRNVDPSANRAAKLSGPTGSIAPRSKPVQRETDSSSAKPSGRSRKTAKNSSAGARKR